MWLAFWMPAFAGMTSKSDAVVLIYEQKLFCSLTKAISFTPLEKPRAEARGQNRYIPLFFTRGLMPRVKF